MNQNIDGAKHPKTHGFHQLYMRKTDMTKTPIHIPLENKKVN